MLAFLPVSSLGIVPVTLGAVPALHPVPPLGPRPLCPAPLPGEGESTLIPPRAPALGVVPGRGLNPLTVEQIGAEAGDCTGTIHVHHVHLGVHPYMGFMAVL